MPKSSMQSGQVLLLILLAMAVVATLVLSVVSRSITDIAVTTQDEQSLRAFSAAEAGVEKAIVDGLAIGLGSSGTVGEATEAEFSSEVGEFPENKRSFIYPTELASGDTATVWLAEHDSEQISGDRGFTGQTFRLCWGKAGVSGAEPAIEVSVFYDEGPELRVARVAYDSSSTRRGENNFSSPAGSGKCTIGEREFGFDSLVDLGSMGIRSRVFNDPGKLKMARVRMLYNTDGEPLGAVSEGSSSNFPVQGKLIESTGSSGDAQRKVEFVNLFSEPPAIFDSAIFSDINLIKEEQ